jgi:hypothetical protein
MDWVALPSNDVRTASGSCENVRPSNENTARAELEVDTQGSGHAQVPAPRDQQHHGWALDIGQLPGRMLLLLSGVVEYATLPVAPSGSAPAGLGASSSGCDEGNGFGMGPPGFAAAADLACVTSWY